MVRLRRKKKSELQKRREEERKLREMQEGEMIVDTLLAEARKRRGILGEVVISPAAIDQMTSINPVTLEGQAEIIYNIMMYRIAKWHWQAAKADEYIMLTPNPPSAFAPVLAQKEKLEGQIKSGLASAAQAVADYELLKHDERKYREILDYFKMGKKDEHVLRALFVDRVDAYTGEGYSMITMAKRWPTIISDFIKMKSKWRDVEKIKNELKVSRAEAVVLKTKNELFLEWEKLFFPDVRDRYSRIKNLVESRRRSVDQYRDWLKPYLERFKRIREVSEIPGHAGDEITNPLKFAHTPEGEIWAKLWFWKPIKPEQMGSPIMLRGQGHDIDPYDDWVREKQELIHKKYDVEFTEEDVRKFIKNWTMPGYTAKKAEVIAVHPGPMFDPRYIYYIFIDLDYNVVYKRGSTGPMVVEDQYFHFHPFLLSQNALVLFLLELEAKKKAFEREINELIGVKEVEREIREKVEDEFEGEEEEKKSRKIKSVRSGAHKLRRNVIRPAVGLIVKPGPYEINVQRRISKCYGDYMGPQVAEIVELIKQTCFRLSGQGI
ncbi:MAG: hypothetical protein GTN38_00045 [Candidatus Aenigmarchaeota archaeon]|nr:hypothetical protein [Candidatus Aenigmarchaeota archaeon]